MLAELHKHCGRAGFSFEHFLLDVVQYFRSQLMDQLHKFRTQLAVFYSRHILQFLLIVHRPDKDKAISILEETHQLLSYTVLSYCHLGGSFLKF